MKNNFSSSIGESLAGRPDTNSVPENHVTEQLATPPEDIILNIESEDSSIETDQKGRMNRGLGKNVDGSFRQSNAGRPTMAKAKKKVQLTLTITPATKEALDAWAETKPRSAANYISEYVEEYLDEIISYFNR